MSKTLTQDQVKHAAKLAKLPIGKDEIQIYTDQLAKILDYVGLLSKVDTSSVEPTYNVTSLKNIVRPDRVEPCQSQEEVLVNAPTKKNGLFLTKGVFDNE